MKIKKTAVLLTVLAMVFSLCACGSSAYKTDAAAPQAAPTAPAYEEYYDYAADSGFTANYSMAEAAMGADGYYAEEPAEPMPEAEGAQAPAVNPQKIIYSASVTVETTEFEKSLENLSLMVGEYAGWIESSSVNGAYYNEAASGRTGGRSAVYTIRVPSESFNALMSGLSVLGNVPFSYTYTENVTSMYYDVEARLKACETQQERLLEMMELAETVEDVIAIEDRLSELQYQIESLKSSLKNWDRQVSYSTVNISIEEVSVYTPVPKTGFGTRLLYSLKNGAESVGDFFENLALGLAEALPALILLAALAWAVIAAIKKISAKRRSKKAPEPAPAGQTGEGEKTEQ